MSDTWLSSQKPFTTLWQSSRELEMAPSVTLGSEAAVHASPLPSTSVE